MISIQDKGLLVHRAFRKSQTVTMISLNVKKSRLKLKLENKDQEVKKEH
jgi:hypothetical protein